MNISITKPNYKFIQTRINNGTYTSANQIIRKGLRALAEKEAQKKVDLELEVNIQEGIKEADAGLGEIYSEKFLEDIFRQRLSANKN